jgi:outer membrane protein assembly factor BamB
LKRVGWASAALLLTAGCGGVEDPAPTLACGGCAADQLCYEGVCLGSASWAVELPVNVQGEVAVAADGVIHASAAREVDQLYQPTLFAISPYGEMLWERPVGTRGRWGFPSRPVLGNDTRIYLTINYALFALDADGDLDWTLDIPFLPDGHIAVNAANPPPAPSIGVDGVIYWQFLAATGVNGDLRWRQYVDPYSPCETALPIGTDRVVFREGHSVIALDNHGEVAWANERPLDYFAEPGCGMAPYGENLVATLWCEPGPSAFVCGHVLFIDVRTGEVRWSTEPPKKVANASSLVMRPDRSMVLFSVGAPGNDEDLAHMWIVGSDGKSVSESMTLPWSGVYHAALGNDGILYATTSKGLAAITERGEVLWRYEPEGIAGSHSGPPAIGGNGCVYYEQVKLDGRRASQREIVCVQSSATGLAASPWPRSIGGNHSGMRSPR